MAATEQGRHSAWAWQCQMAVCGHNAALHDRIAEANHIDSCRILAYVCRNAQAEPGGADGAAAPLLRLEASLLVLEAIDEAGERNCRGPKRMRHRLQLAGSSC